MLTSSSSLAFELTDEQRALRDTIREFAESEIASCPEPSDLAARG